MANCTSCGAKLEKGAYKCSKCGTIVNEYRDITHSPAYASANYDAPPPKISRYAPLGVWGFLGNMILLSIPVIGAVVCIIWALGGAYNRNRVNMARAYLLVFVISVLLLCLSFAIMYFTGVWTQTLILYDRISTLFI